MEPTKTTQQLALELLEQGRRGDAERLLAATLETRQDAELWNDWATVKAGAGSPADVEAACRGYERALELAPEYAQAEYNLGVLRMLQGRAGLGVPLLRRAAPHLAPEDRAHAEALLAEHDASTEAGDGVRSLDARPAARGPERPRSRSMRVLLVHENLPRFDRSGSDLRILQVVRRLRGNGHRLTYVARCAVEADRRYRAALDELGVEVYAHDAERLAPLGIDAAPAWRLEEVLAGGAFDVALLFHWFWAGISCTEHYLDDLRRLSPATRVVVLTDDRHGVRELRGAELSGLPADRERGLDFLARERECYRAADLVASITEEDRQGLLELDPGLPIELLPMTAECHESGVAFEGRRGFVFLANFDNVANRDAMAWLLDEIWPRIRARLPDATLDLVGNNVPADPSRPGVRVIGHVPRLADAFDCRRVFLSPIRIGTGIKTKNLAALGHGIPMVTTTVGAEGMSLRDGENALVADAPGGFASRAVELHERRGLWESLACAGPRHVAEEFSVARLDAALERILDRAFAEPARRHDPAHRFSFREVEACDPGVLTAPVAERPLLRVRAYLALAERRLADGRPAEALAQVRHVFTYLRGRVPPSLLGWRIFRALERGYRASGDGPAADRYAREANASLPRPDPKLLRSARRHGDERAISVVLPTFERRETLERCLVALGSQTLPADEFEVVVVDDGSGDGTDRFLAEARTGFRLVVHRQQNRGAGAARAAAVARSRGTYLLLANDDTIADPRLLESHLAIQRRHHDACFAVLGAFDYEPGARRRALTWVLSQAPLLFPQRAMNPELYYGPAQFVTCNLSIRRDAVLAAGSFDPSFRIGEDTDLGIRLAALGTRVLHAPEARAWHDHAELSVSDLVRRARAYGQCWLQLLQKHRALCLSQLGVRVAAPVGASDVERVRLALAPRRAEMESLVGALERYDAKGFEVDAGSPEGRAAAERMVRSFTEALQQVHWHHVLEGLCAAWEARNGEEGAPPRLRVPA